MPGKPAPKIIRAQRHDAALRALAAGEPFHTVVSRIADDWGCSRRQARNVANGALKEIAIDFEKVDIVPMLAATIHRLERIAAKAEAAGQYAAAVGAARSLHEFAIEPHSKHRSGQNPGRSPY